MNYRSLRSSGEFSDLVVQVRGKDFHLHRFPLLAHCEYFRGLQRSGMSDDSFVKLDLLPGGSNTMSLVADFCYGIPIGDKITTGNVGHVTCASSYLQMSEPGSLGNVCKDKLEMLTRDANNCIEILVSCWDVVVAAEAENVTSLYIQGAVQYWNREFAKMGKSWFPLERAQKWFAGLKKLPVKWVIKIMDSMQAKGCNPLLRTYFAARFLDCIMQHYSRLASQARLFRAVAELTARESHEEEELLPELLQREKSLVAFENVIVTWDPRSGFIACIRLILFPKELVTVIALIH